MLIIFYFLVQIFEAAVRGLTPVQGPLPVKFPLPDPTDHFSIRPRFLSLKASSSGAVVRSDRVNAAIAGARAAATQFSRNSQGMGPTADNVSEESSGVGPARGGPGATIAGEQAETELSLKNDKSLSSTKVEVSATAEGLRAVAARSFRSSHVMGPTEGVSTERRGGRRGSNAQFGGTNKVYIFSSLLV